MFNACIKTQYWRKILTLNKHILCVIAYTIYKYTHTHIKSKVGDCSRGLQHQSATPFSGLLHFTLDPYHIMLSVRQGGITYHF